MKWYIGQRVVAIISHSRGEFRKGDEFVINGIRTAPCKCNNLDIDIGKITNGVVSYCVVCNTTYGSNGNVYWFNECCFAPLAELSDYTSDELINELEKELVKV